jgi:hypothetical protein
MTSTRAVRALYAATVRDAEGSVRSGTRWREPASSSMACTFARRLGFLGSTLPARQRSSDGTAAPS